MAEPYLDLSVLTEATEADLARSLEYSLQWGAAGKPHGKWAASSRAEMLCRNLAAWRARHLLMSGYVILRRPPAKDHTAG